MKPLLRTRRVVARYHIAKARPVAHAVQRVVISRHISNRHLCLLNGPGHGPWARLGLLHHNNSTLGHKTTRRALRCSLDVLGETGRLGGHGPSGVAYGRLQKPRLCNGICTRLLHYFQITRYLGCQDCSRVVICPRLVQLLEPSICPLPCLCSCRIQTTDQCQRHRHVLLDFVHKPDTRALLLFRPVASSICRAVALSNLFLFFGRYRQSRLGFQLS